MANPKRAAALIAGLSAAWLATYSRAAECPAPVIGTYTNTEYGFEFVVPGDLQGRWQSPCTVDKTGRCICLGNHGLSFDLRDGTVLGVFADYAAELDEPTLGDVLYAALRRIVTADQSVHITAVRHTTLKGHAGFLIEAVTSAKGAINQGPVQRVEYLFFSDGVRVDVYLHAPRARFKGDKRYLNELLTTWKWKPR